MPGSPQSLFARLRQRIWPTGPDQAPLELNQRRIYVLPTRAGVLYGTMLILMLVASINYNLSLGYALTFLLAGLGIVAIVHTFRNLSGLRISPGRHLPGFAGETLHYGIQLDSNRETSRGERPGLKFQLADGAGLEQQLQGALDLNLPFAAARRGWQDMPRLTISTVWPLGIVRAWSYARLPERCLVYPAPAPTAPPFVPVSGDEGQQRHSEPDDFFGLRPHQLTDFIQHIAWKASARQDEGLLTKQFASQRGETLYFSLQATPGASIEEKLSIMARWLLDAHSANQSFGLDLGRTKIPPGQGSDHLHACLRALALHA